MLLTVATVRAQGLQAPTYAVGDTWTFKWGSETRDVKVVKLGDDGSVDMAGFLFSCASCIAQLDRNLTILALHDAGGKPADLTQLTFVPLGGQWLVYNFPLEPQKRWDFSAMGYLRGRTRTYQLANRVDGVEEVTTPAGTFRAYKIVRDWVLKPASSAFINQRDAIWRTTTWFAPDVKFNVKTTSTDPNARESELISYRVK